METRFQSPSVEEAFRAAAQRKAELHRRIVNRVLDEVSTNPQPLTIRDLRTILAQDGLDLAMTTVGDAISELLEMGKIVSRKETRDEAVIRGGGSMPKARRPLLFAAAPGPVPTRTALPPGVEPHRTLDDRIVELLGQRLPKGTARPRSIGRISTMLGDDTTKTRDALERLIARGVVYYDPQNSSYFLESRRRAPRSAPPVSTDESEPTGVVTAVGGAMTSSGHDDTAEPVKDRTQELVEQIGSLVGELASNRPATDTRQLHRTIESQRSEINDLRTENAQLLEKLDRLESLRARVQEIFG